MPLITAIFPDAEEVRDLLRTSKTLIREAVAFHTGYPFEEVSLFPQMIRADVADNLPDLLLVIDVGAKCKGHAERIGNKILLNLTAAVDGMLKMRVIVLLKVAGDNGYAAHDPSLT